MPGQESGRRVKVHPWSWHRIFMLFALTLIMILGFVVIGGGSAMQSEYGKTETRRAIFLSDIVLKSDSKRTLLRQLITAWRCDIPPARLPPALAAVSGNSTPPCDSDLMTQMTRGGQGTLATGVLAALAATSGFAGALTGRSEPLALYIVVTVVTAVIELAAVGLLVYNKAQLDHVTVRAEALLDQQLVGPVFPSPGGLVPGPDGVLTGPGQLPSPPPDALPSGRQAGGGGGDGAASSGAAEIPVMSASFPTSTVAVKVDARRAGGKETSASTSVSSPSAGTHSTVRHDSTTNPDNLSRAGAGAHGATSAPPELLPAAGGSASPLPVSRPAAASAGGPAGRRRRQSDGQEDDLPEQVVGHWSAAATECLLHGAEEHHAPCFSQLEDNLETELDRAEVVLDLMLTPLVCAFIACLVQLATICAAWNMIRDEQRQTARQPPPPAEPQEATGV